MTTPAEIVDRFTKRYPGAWQGVPSECVWPFMAGAALAIHPNVLLLVRETPYGAVHFDCHQPGIGLYRRFYWPPSGSDLLTHAVFCVADVVQLQRRISADTLPPWLADPVRRQLRTRAGELLTLAGFSPADVVSAAETVDEALCKRPAVEVTGVLRALMAIGMSCRWATGANEAADDYVGFVSRRLDVVAAERDALAARMSAARTEILRLADIGLADPTTMEREYYELQAVAQAAAKETAP